MKPETLAAGVIFAIGLAVATVLLPRHWKHEIGTLDGAGEFVTSVMRIMPIAIAGGWLTVGGAILLPFVPSEPPESLAFAVPFALAVFLAALLICTVWFWNRPKFLVPPHLRDQPGTLTGIFRRPRRGRRSSSRRT